MTTQEYYEGVRDYFSRPGATLAKDDVGCLYRTSDGRGCAVGCMIPGKLYDKSFEGIGIVTLITPGFDEFAEELQELFDDVNKDFLIDAQHTHDVEADDAEHFVKLLDQLAAEYSLNVLSVDER